MKSDLGELTAITRQVKVELGTGDESTPNSDKTLLQRDHRHTVGVRGDQEGRRNAGGRVRRVEVTGCVGRAGLHIQSNSAKARGKFADHLLSCSGAIKSAVMVGLLVIAANRLPSGTVG
jgi:hypothetical protein